jgi:hypothetical protein
VKNRLFREAKVIADLGLGQTGKFCLTCGGNLSVEFAENGDITFEKQRGIATMRL